MKGDDQTTTGIDFESLSERQKRGAELWRRAQMQNGLVISVCDDSTLWFSQSDTTRAYQVERQLRNRRGTLGIEYRCQCQDFIKHGAIDCKHIFAEKLRRAELVIADECESVQRASRRPPPRVNMKWYR